MRAQNLSSLGLGVLLAISAGCEKGSSARNDAIVATPTAAQTPNPAGNLDQCANGPLDAPVDCTTEDSWVNGNLNANKAHYFEGQSVAYRLRMSNIPVAAGNTVEISWDTTKDGAHALDYVTTYNRSVTADPCVGVAGCSASSTFAIPLDPMVTAGPDGVPGNADDIVQAPGVFTLFGGSITEVSGYTLDGTFAGTSTRFITITFTATTTTPVLAWGGHISLRREWKPQPTAVNIEGSPYHVALIDLNGKGGRQDRSLAAAAVYAPPTLLVIKHVINDNGGTAVASDFTMDVSGNGPDPASFPGSETGTLVTFAGEGTYGVSETGPTNYEASYSADCSGTLAWDDEKTCTVTNDDIDLCLGVVCPDADQCHVAGACDPATGECTSQVPKPDGTPCNDGNVCTIDTCQAGVCVGAVETVAPTRTVGFFMNHEAALSECLMGGAVNVGLMEITTLEQALGLFWAVPLRFPDGGLRSPFDRVALHLMRQTLAATCNHRLFGATNGALVAASVAALEGTDCTNHLGDLELDLLLANDTGIDEPLPAGFDPGPITPSHARSIAEDPTFHVIDPACVP